MFLKLFFLKNPPIPILIPGVRKSSLSGETNIEETRFKVIVCDLFSPPIPIPSVSQSSLPVETNIEKHVLNYFYGLYGRIEKCIKMITSAINMNVDSFQTKTDKSQLPKFVKKILSNVFNVPDH